MGALADHASFRQQQEEILEAVLRVFAADPNILGVAATGSFARGQNDSFSDLDVDAYFVDDSRTGVAAFHKRIGQLTPTLSVLYLYDADGLYLFENGAGWT